MDFVTHTCKKCGCAFVAEDYTHVKNTPPSWRYCPDCAEKLGIDYDKQTPKRNRTPEQQQKIDVRMEKLKKIGAEKLREYHRNKKHKQANL